jgi:hypothetical protein
MEIKKIKWSDGIRIIVAHGAKDACLKDLANNVTGSVAVSYGDASESSNLEKSNPLRFEGSTKKHEKVR